MSTLYSMIDLIRLSSQEGSLEPTGDRRDYVTKMAMEIANPMYHDGICYGPRTRDEMIGLLYLLLGHNKMEQLRKDFEYHEHL